MNWHSHTLFALLAMAAELTLLAMTVTATPRPAIESILTRYGLAKEDVGYLLFDPADGRTIAEHRADEPRIPASTAKVVTLVAALQILGADYRFETSLLATGEVKAGTLQGDLYLRGGGDPTLTTDDLEEFVAALRQAGIRHITGSFAFDETLLRRTSQIDAAQPIAVSYNPGISALSLNYNRIELRWERRPGSSAFATTVLSPADGGFLPVEEIATGLLPPGFDRRITFLHHNDAVLDRWLLSPALSAQGQVQLPVKNDPGHVAALLFRTLCRQHGIDLPAPRAATIPAAARVLYSHRSEPLSQVAAGVLRYSNNLSAELIGQVATHKLSGRPLSLRESGATLANWYRQTLPDTDWRSFVSANHSGLSSASRHSPRQMAAILRYGWTLSAGGSTFLQLLSPPLWECENGRPILTVKAKSGTMSYADGLAGYLTTRSGRQLGFAILITDFTRRAELDATMDVRIADTPPEAREWTEHAKELERALVMSWAAQY